ncbi:MULTISPECIES: hypothetical protein [unclassified Flavobacterium]|jgi:hypothetical protein|uniref:hypothetical protein n=1 Tax=unclassified Flavobacterium TaxID=196869 RepID=UPI00034D5664|nr:MULTISPECIES: hypothetical protein [unclassified Flavobacterium]URC11251.1 hypothetical protein M4I44_14220 [Flavobacterium sp. B183]
MKKKNVLIPLFMSVTVLFAMLFQTLHSYEHVYKQLTSKHCEHTYIEGQKQITHSHTVDNNCQICHFTFSTFIPNTFQTYSFLKATVETFSAFFYEKTISVVFKGSLFALRAPPFIR